MAMPGRADGRQCLIASCRMPQFGVSFDGTHNYLGHLVIRDACRRTVRMMAKRHSD
jgi:hypothetical protein